jgi:hypothetical protein
VRRIRRPWLVLVVEVAGTWLQGSALSLSRSARWFALTVSR